MLRVAGKHGRSCWQAVTLHCCLCTVLPRAEPHCQASKLFGPEALHGDRSE
jgi:hypothetical protein